MSPARRLRLLRTLTFFTACFIGNSAARALDVDAAVETLGNPFQKGAYARNVWNMQVFSDRVYLAHGDTSNGGPTPNAGPIPIFSFNPATGQFTNEFTADDEQLSAYRIINGRLCAPGMDAREDWSFGNFYRLEDTGWKKHRTIPNGVHVYDLYDYKGELFVHLTGGSVVMSSTDSGASWRNVPGAPSFGSFTFFELNGLLQGANGGGGFGSMWFEYNGASATRRTDLTQTVLFPGTVLPASVQVTRPVTFAGKALYLGEGQHADITSWANKFIPFAAFAVHSLSPGAVDIRKIPLPSTDLPWDLLSRNDAVYLLASEKQEGTPDRFIIKAYRSSDLTTWTEVFRFTQPTFARSFEEINGDFYFGLGTDFGLAYTASSYTDDTRPEAGNILRVRKAAYAPGGDAAPPAAPRMLRRR